MKALHPISCIVWASVILLCSSLWYVQEKWALYLWKLFGCIYSSQGCFFVNWHATGVSVKKHVQVVLALTFCTIFLAVSSCVPPLPINLVCDLFLFFVWWAMSSDTWRQFSAMFKIKVVGFIEADGNMATQGQFGIYEKKKCVILEGTKRKTVSMQPMEDITSWA